MTFFTPVTAPGSCAAVQNERNTGCQGSDISAGGNQSHNTNDNVSIDNIPLALQQSNIETFFKMAYAWFPILHPDADAASTADVRSPLLRHALALFAGRLRPPLTPHATHEEHYQRARYLFYNVDQADPLDRIRAAMLLHWCSSTPPGGPSLDSSFWWAGVAIRLAQDIGLHREPKQGDANSSINRCIWWTLYVSARA